MNRKNSYHLINSNINNITNNITNYMTNNITNLYKYFLLRFQLCSKKNFPNEVRLANLIQILFVLDLLTFC